MKIADYVGKEVRVKSNCTHPHAGSSGTVLRVETAKLLNKKALIIKEEKFGEEFFVFNIDQLQILD